MKRSFHLCETIIANRGFYLFIERNDQLSGILFVYLLHEVTKIVYFIGNEHMLIAHDSNRLRFS